MRKLHIIAATLGCLMLAGCISDYCDNLYHTSEVWLYNGTSEPLYYTFSDTPYLTPECPAHQLPVKLAYILDFKRFSPSQVMASPTYTPNGHRGCGEEYGYYPYLLLLRYDNSIVACYDVSRTALAMADYPWFKPEADSNWMQFDTIGECHDAETTYVYAYYITDSIL